MNTNSKITISGNHIEVLKTEVPIIYGYKDSRQRNKARQIDPEKIKENRLNTLRKTKSYVKQLVNANNYFWYRQLGKRYNPALVTLTFRKNEQNLDYANREFSKFIQRLNHLLHGKEKQQLCYLAVIEFQKDIDFSGNLKPDGGSIHYHILIFNLPYIPRIYDRLRPVWKHGTLNHRSIKQIKDIANYLCKYMLKDVEDQRLTGRKCYFRSKNLQEPEVSMNQETNKEIMAVLPEEYKTFEKTFPVKYHVSMEYIKYELPYEHSLLQKI